MRQRRISFMWQRGIHLMQQRRMYAAEEDVFDVAEEDPLDAEVEDSAGAGIEDEGASNFRATQQDHSTESQSAFVRVIGHLGLCMTAHSAVRLFSLGCNRLRPLALQWEVSASCHEFYFLSHHVTDRVRTAGRSFLNGHEKRGQPTHLSISCRTASIADVSRR